MVYVVVIVGANGTKDQRFESPLLVFKYCITNLHNLIRIVTECIWVN
jgi:hypothetical protein